MSVLIIENNNIDIYSEVCQMAG